MPEDPNILQPDARRLLAKYRRQLLEHADASSKELAVLMQRIESKILSAIRRGEGSITISELNQVTATINRLILESHPEVARWLAREIPIGQLNGLATQAAFLRAGYGARTWAELPVTRIRDTFISFEQAIKARRLLRLDNETLRNRWLKEWDLEWANTARGLRDEFVRGHVQGLAWDRVAERIEDDLGRLNIAGKMDSETFAKGFARAKLTEAANDASIAAAHEAGIDRFINVGVSDHRQSPECREASSYEPMTLEEWDASPVGRPPRHVLNCRCDLAGVPPQVQDEVLIG